MSGPTFHYEIVQGTDEWRMARLGIPTASEFKRIITPKTAALSASSVKYRNRLLAEWVLGREVVEDDYVSDFMQDGIEREESTVESFEFMTDLQTKHVGIVTAESGKVAASPDRLVLQGGSNIIGTLEVKSPTPAVHVGYLMDPESLFDAYRVQILGQLWVCELDKGFAHANCAPLPPIRPVEIGRDEKYISQMSSAVMQFVEDLDRCKEEWTARYGAPKPPVIRKSKNAEEFNKQTFDEAWQSIAWN